MAQSACLQNTPTASLQRGKTAPHQTSVLDMTLNHLMVRFRECWVPLYCHRSKVHSGPRVVARDCVLSIAQIEWNSVLILNWTVYMYKMDLAWNNLQGLVCHKTKPTQTSSQWHSITILQYFHASLPNSNWHSLQSHCMNTFGEHNLFFSSQLWINRRAIGVL